MGSISSNHKKYTTTSGASQALRLFHRAAESIPAYKDFLKRQTFDPKTVKTIGDFQRIPLTDKGNYISRYPLADLCWDGKLQDLPYIVSSSGSTGNPFYWPRGAVQDDMSMQLYRLVFEESFGLDATPTLIINSYGQGTWIAGTELYNSARLLAQSYPNITVINPGIDLDLCITQLQELGSNFGKIIICGYPPLIRDLIHVGISRQLPWRKLNVYLVTAGEAISESWRHYIQDILGDGNRINNIYGLADAGVVAAETPSSLQLKSLNAENLPGVLGSNRMVGLLQYLPSARYFENDAEHRLILTTNSGLPLIRYDTKDHGVVLSAKELRRQLTQQHMMIPASLTDESLPVLSLFGREDFSTTLYAVNIYPENIRPIVDDQHMSSLLTGRFVMHTKHQASMEQYLELDIELAPSVKATREFRANLQAAIVAQLRRSNSEYNELYAKIGKKVAPKLLFKPYNSIGYTLGKKHRWVKHD